MKKLKLLSALAFASTAFIALASCSGKNNNKDTEPYDDVYYLQEDKVEKVTIDVATSRNANNNIYVSPTGTKDGDGSKEKPYDFVTATTKVEAGTNIIMAEGRYTFNERIPVGKPNNQALYSEIIYNGAPGKYITVQPEKDDAGNYKRVIFDFSAMKFDDANRGIQVYGNYWYFYGLEVTGAGDNGMYIAGNHNIVDNCQFYNNRDTGLQIGRGGGSQETLDQWPGFNLVKNCTSFANYDDMTLGENADGFAAKLTVGHMNIFDGCIAFRNSDDGWDLYAKQDSGNIGTVLIYNCVSFENGFLPYRAQPSYIGTKYAERAYDTQNGDGIGFKLGGSTMTGDVIMENTFTFNNKYHGVSDNSNPGFLSLKNVTAYNNCVGFDEDGKITDTRGISYATNKSNNIDLARTIGSYNNFYGILSYVDNQDNYEAEGDNLYNADAFRGSTAYSIFQTTRDTTERYVQFGDYVDGSSYHTESQDIPYDGGTEYVFDSNPFKSCDPINATCDGRDQLETLLHFHNDFRNEDGSVNMGDLFALKDGSSLKTFANGEAVGATLNKSSMTEYSHPEYFSFLTSNKEMTSDMERVLSAYMALNPITNQDATFQDFDITNLINGCEITWESSNTDVIKILSNERVSKSMSVETTAHVFVPAEKTTVKLTATIKYATATIKKEFNIDVCPRNQYLGELASTGADSIRVSIYSTYYAPRVYPIDASSINSNEIDPTLYDLTYKYEYAADGKSKLYEVDGVDTSNPGMYKITATAVLKADESQVSVYTFKVYVVDPDCSIDFINSSIILNADGFSIAGELSNVEGYVKAYVSRTDEGDLTAEQLVAKTGVQEFKVSTDSIVAPFEADNRVTSSVAYYIYYTVVNDNMSNIGEATVYKRVVNTVAIDSETKFQKLARTGTPDGTDYSSTLTIFYLTKDLDFNNDWDTTTTTGDFKGLFNGNNYTISNIKVTAKPSKAHYVNVFYSVKNGSIMDVKFDNVVFNCIDSSNGKRMGIVGAMQGGYIDNVRITNSSFVGYEAVGGLVGQVTGGDNFINNCSLVNPIEFYTPVEANAVYEEGVTYYNYKYESVDDTYNYVAIKADSYEVDTPIYTNGEPTDPFAKIYILPNRYTISTKNKYQGGLVGNAQIADSGTYLNITMTNNYVSATIGDGSDTGGNSAGILARCKNDSDKYNVTLCYNYFDGIIISQGLYGAGILGDLDNGLGYINVHHNFALVTFVYKGQYLNADDRYFRALAAGGEALSEVQKTAHKNLNPIIGRATSSNAKLYFSEENFGDWAENYNKLSISTSLVYGSQSYNMEEHIFTRYYVTRETFVVVLKFDPNIWDIYSTTETLTFKENPADAEATEHTYTQFRARLKDTTAGQQ
jgi:hypothetical protein